jgi:hypothetical protein
LEIKLEDPSKAIKKQSEKSQKKVRDNINRFIKTEMLRNPKFRSLKGEQIKHSSYVFTEFGNITKSPLEWTVEEVGKRMTKLYGEKIAKAFTENDVDGKCLLSLSKDDLHHRLHLSLGLTITIFNHILFYRADVIERFFRFHQVD